MASRHLLHRRNHTIFTIRTFLVWLLVFVAGIKFDTVLCSNDDRTSRSSIQQHETTIEIDELVQLSKHMDELLLLGDTKLMQYGTQEVVVDGRQRRDSSSIDLTTAVIEVYLDGIKQYTSSTTITALYDQLQLLQHNEQRSDDMELLLQDTIEIMTAITTTLISLYTNLGTAYSMLLSNDKNYDTNNNNNSTTIDQNFIIDSYRNSIKVYQHFITVYGRTILPTSTTLTNEYSPTIDEKLNDMKLIIAQSSFYLGMVFQDLEVASSFSIEAYRYAISLDPYHWSSYSNLGSIYHDQNRDYNNARVAYTIAYHLLTNPEIHITDPPQDNDQYNYLLSQLQYRIGVCLSNNIVADTSSSSDDPSNTKENERCIVLKNDTTLDINFNNSINYETRDCKEMATHSFALAIQYDPNNVSAKHMLASLTADATIQRASNVYVKDLFDQYAKNFEHSLVHELQYTGYERLRRGFDRAMEQHVEFFNETNSKIDIMLDIVVDAGCGTGLVGEQFRNISKSLVGIDLSEVIIQKALQTRPKLYDRVLVGDITTIISNAPLKQTISLIIAADSFIYFGDLEPLFMSIYDGLVEDISTTTSTVSTSIGDGGGFVAFTLENVSPENEIILNTDKPNWKWQLTASGRFAHRKDYVIDAARQHGLDLIYYEPMDGFRYEHRTEVRGHLFVMMKKKHTTSLNQDEL